MAAGSAFVRSMPELNMEAGLQWTWDAFEQFMFPRIYATLFPLIVRKVRSFPPLHSGETHSTHIHT